MEKLLYPGSFDPWHAGHQFIYDSACELVGKENVFIGLAINPGKIKPGDYFSDHIKKAEFLKWTMAPLNANIVIIGKTSVEMCREIGAKFMVRGLRPSYDLPQEAALDFWNRRVSDFTVKTLFFMPPEDLNHLSSSVVKDLIRFDLSKNLEEFINPYILERWKNGRIPENSLYFGPKCVGKSTYCEGLAISNNTKILDCDKEIWKFFSKNKAIGICKRMKNIIEKQDFRSYPEIMDEIAFQINWEEFLRPNVSHEASALGMFFKYIPASVVGKFQLIKINTYPEIREERARKRKCWETLKKYDFFYQDPPFYDKKIFV